MVMSYNISSAFCSTPQHVSLFVSNQMSCEVAQFFRATIVFQLCKNEAKGSRSQIWQRMRKISMVTELRKWRPKRAFQRRRKPLKVVQRKAFKEAKVSKGHHECDLTLLWSSYLEDHERSWIGSYENFVQSQQWWSTKASLTIFVVRTILCNPGEIHRVILKLPGLLDWVGIPL